MDKVVPTDYQKSIVIGLLLGDGYLYKDGKLQVEQAAFCLNSVQKKRKNILFGYIIS